MRICFVGDSFVNGTGDHQYLGWPGRLCVDARRHGRDVTHYNLGIRRDTSSDIAARWEREVSARLPAEFDGRVVFSFGVNDCVHTPEGVNRVALEQSIINTRTILSTARARWPILMVGPPWTSHAAVDERVQRLSMKMSDVCAEIEVPYLSTYDSLEGDELWRRETAEGDGIHPGEGGYALIHQAVSTWPAWTDWFR